MKGLLLLFRCKQLRGFNSGTIMANNIITLYTNIGIILVKAGFIQRKDVKVALAQHKADFINICNGQLTTFKKAILKPRSFGKINRLHFLSTPTKYPNPYTVRNKILYKKTVALPSKVQPTWT